MCMNPITFITSSKPYQVLASKRKASHEASAAFADVTNPPILVYTMGKVGSSTVCSSLHAASLPNPVLHLHFLSADLPRHRQTHQDAGIWPLPDHLYLGDAIRRQLLKNRNFPVKIISLVRDPVAFLISGLFEVPQFAEESVFNDTGTVDPHKAAAYLNRKLADPDAFGYVFNWFDKELKAVFGIDVFATPFPVESGYAVYRQGSAEALVLRLEDLSAQGPQAIADFLGLDEPLILKHENVRADLTEKTAYQQVQEGVLLDPEMCRKIYATDFVKHFYSEAMIRTFIAKLTQRTT